MLHNAEIPEDANRTEGRDVALADANGEKREKIDSPEASWGQRIMGKARRLKNEYLTVAKLKGLAANVTKGMLILAPSVLLGGAIGAILGPSFGTAASSLANIFLKGMIEAKPDTILGALATTSAESNANTLKAVVAAQIASS